MLIRPTSSLLATADVNTEVVTVIAVYSIHVFNYEEARRGRPNATNSAERERDTSAVATRDGGGGRGGHPRSSLVHRVPPPIAITVVLYCCLVLYLPPLSIDRWRWEIRVGGIVKIRQKSKSFSCHTKTLKLVINMKALLFRS